MSLECVIYPPLNPVSKRHESFDMYCASLTTSISSANCLRALVWSPRQIKYANVVRSLDIISRREKSHVGDENTRISSVLVLILSVIITDSIERSDQLASGVIRHSWVEDNCRHILAFT